MRARHRHFNPKDAGAVVAIDARFGTGSNGSAISSLTCRAGVVFSQATSIKQPLWEAPSINGQPAINFDGSNDGLQATGVALQGHFTSIVVADMASTSDSLWWEHGADVNSNDGAFFAPKEIGAWAIRRSGALHDGPSVNGTDWFEQSANIGSIVYDGTGTVRKAGAFYSNSTRSGTARADTSITANLNIASRNQASLFVNGDVAQLAIYNKPLESSLRRRAEHAAAYSFKISCN